MPFFFFSFVSSLETPKLSSPQLRKALLREWDTVHGQPMMSDTQGKAQRALLIGPLINAILSGYCSLPFTKPICVYSSSVNRHVYFLGQYFYCWLFWLWVCFLCKSQPISLPCVALLMSTDCPSSNHCSFMSICHESSNVKEQLALTDKCFTWQSHFGGMFYSLNSQKTLIQNHAAKWPQTIDPEALASETPRIINADRLFYAISFGVMCSASRDN